MRKVLSLLILLVASGCQGVSTTDSTSTTTQPNSSPSPLATPITYNWDISGYANITAGVCSGPYYVVVDNKLRQEYTATLEIKSSSTVKIYNTSGCSPNTEISSLDMSVGAFQSKPFYLLDSTVQTQEMFILNMYLSLPSDSPDTSLNPNASYSIFAKQSYTHQNI
jgi:hypothetical protein